MNAEIELSARVLAYDLRHAVTVRSTASITPDPAPAFGIAPIYMVSERRVLAVAYGVLGVGSLPAVVAEPNPLGRTTVALEPLADKLAAYCADAIATGRIPRIWLVDPIVLNLLELLAHRHRKDPQSSPLMRVLGQLCAALLAESRYPDQQVVAVAMDLLREHVVTGQSPGADHHPGALLAWLRPPPGVNPADEAARRLLIPQGPAMLHRADDDEVERLRKVARGTGAASHNATAKIATILERAARQEFAQLEQLRGAFWDLALPSPPDRSRLENRSLARIAFALDRDPEEPSRARSLGRLLELHEEGAALVEEVDVLDDARIREQARQEGRVIRATLVGVTQPRPRCKPCSLVLQTRQEVLRLRRGTELQTLDRAAAGRVAAVNETPSGETQIELRLTKGFRVPWSQRIGDAQDWTDAISFDSSFLRGRIYREMDGAQAPLVYGNALPPPTPHHLPATDLIAIAERLKMP